MNQLLVSTSTNGTGGGIEAVEVEPLTPLCGLKHEFGALLDDAKAPARLRVLRAGAERKRLERAAQAEPHVGVPRRAVCVDTQHDPANCGACGVAAAYCDNGVPLAKIAIELVAPLSTTAASSFVTANGGTPTTAEVALFSGITTGRAYLNIHSSVFGGGEIRGFLLPIPEPATLGILVPAMLLTARRSKQARR